MSPDRKKQPEFKDIDTIVIPKIEKRILDNNIEVYLINSGTQDILKIDLIFETNNFSQKNPIVASTVNKMLVEGTNTLTSQQIAEKLDFYGAFIQLTPTKDSANITLYTLRKYLPDTIKILRDIIRNPSFSENELNIHLNNKKQKFLVEMEKVTELARREFNEQLFGKNHPYGRKIRLENYDEIKQNDLILFHTDNYIPLNCKIIISGKIKDHDFQLFNSHFGDKDWVLKPGEDLHFDYTPQITMESFIEKKNVTQSAIRLGKTTILKSHPDYHNLDVVNTILGGYFGSRLMKAIREEKGYTYGIYSALVTLKNAGFIVILTEVGSDVTKNAVNDILMEVKKLREELVSADELNLVKNYMLGELLRSFDGPLELSSSYKSVIELGLSTDFFRHKFEAIKSITPEIIHNMANKYLHEDTLIKTVAGKYN